jgi:hypothetical protein
MAVTQAQIIENGNDLKGIEPDNQAQDNETNHVALALFLGASTMHSQSSALNRPQPVTLHSLRNSHRPLLVFAPDTNAQFLSPKPKPRSSTCRAAVISARSYSALKTSPDAAG